MIFSEEITVPVTVADLIDYLLSHEPKTEEECFGEDLIVTYSCKFGNTDVEMDIKLCGVYFEDGESNLPWTEAVLFKNGSEVNYTEVCDEYFGEWELEYNGDTYKCTVRKEM